MSRFERNGRHGGSWTIICDGTETGDFWNSLRFLDFDVPHLVSRPPLKLSMHQLDGSPFTKIYCYTSACKDDEKTIRNSAEYIRSRIDYTFALSYYNFDEGINKFYDCSFLHTPDGELYKFNGEDFRLTPLSKYTFSTIARNNLQEDKLKDKKKLVTK